MTIVFCWGNGQDGQLGICGLDEAIVSKPRQLTVGDGKTVVNIACGGKHTLITTKDGSLYTCGNNDQGQLGHNKSSRRLGKSSYLKCTLSIDNTTHIEDFMSYIYTGQRLSTSHYIINLYKAYTTNVLIIEVFFILYTNLFVICFTFPTDEQL